MNESFNTVIKLTNFAVERIHYFLKNEKRENLKFRIYITGGGCSGFQYGFCFDDKISKDDFLIGNYNVDVVVDFMSLQYLHGSIIDYYDGLESSKFIVTNPNAQITCSCGSSFNI